MLTYYFFPVTSIRLRNVLLIIESKVLQQVYFLTFWFYLFPEYSIQHVRIQYLMVVKISRSVSETMPLLYFYRATTPYMIHEHTKFRPPTSFRYKIRLVMRINFSFLRPHTSESPKIPL